MRRATTDVLGGQSTLAVLALLVVAVAGGAAWQLGVLGGGATLSCGQLTEQQRERYAAAYGGGELPVRDLASFDAADRDAVRRAVAGASRNDTGSGVSVDGGLGREPFFVQANGNIYRCAAES